MEAYYPDLIALAQIIMIDVVLAGDNAIVVGLAASRVAPQLRARVIFWGIAGAVVLRIVFAAVTSQLLAIVGLTLAGGLLLLWVCWKMYREVVGAPPIAHSLGAAATAPHHADGSGQVRTMSFWAALGQIIVADVSMSLDNVLAVAGAAKGNTWVLVVGLAIAVVMMAIAASYIAKLLSRFPWITWIGLVVILYVALEMVWSGGYEVACRFVANATCEAGAFTTFRAVIGV
jgi:YjbE family integral membrane protein